MFFGGSALYSKSIGKTMGQEQAVQYFLENSPQPEPVVRFEIQGNQRFQNTVLGGGALSLPGLETRILRWLGAKKKPKH